MTLWVCKTKLLFLEWMHFLRVKYLRHVSLNVNLSEPSAEWRCITTSQWHSCEKLSRHPCASIFFIRLYSCLFIKFHGRFYLVSVFHLNCPKPQALLGSGSLDAQRFQFLKKAFQPKTWIPCCCLGIQQCVPIPSLPLVSSGIAAGSVALKQPKHIFEPITRGVMNTRNHSHI